MTLYAPRLSPAAITAYSTINACGVGNAALLQALQNNQSFLSDLALFSVLFPTLVGEIKHPLAMLRAELSDYQSRNAQVALTALNYQPDGLRAAIESAKARYGGQRIGVIIGTSTSGLYETESAYRYLLQHHEMPADFHFVTRHAYQATGRFLQLELGLSGVCFAVSTACSSSAKALAAGQRLIANGVCDAVLVGGVDTLCRLTLRGFSSLDLVSATPCTPMDKNRRGITIGEAAALLLLEKTTPQNQHCPLLFAVGESSDAYHMSHPHPDGLGAIAAMQNALTLAGLSHTEIDYLNLHATATRVNDAVESKAVYAVFADKVPCSGTKGITGHTLGAAGALETIIALLALEAQFIPATCGLTALDEACDCQVVKKPLFNQALKRVMSNSFGFGGNNASVIVGREQDLADFKNQTALSKMFVKSAAVCCPDAEVLAQFGLDGRDVDLSLLPSTLRRRTSLSTRLAITAATDACRAAQIDTASLPSIFVSLGGEIQVTDALCRLLPNPEALLSPTQFHNSVHNTTAGYWGILNHCQAASTAIAAVDDGFAMALIEAWSQLQQQKDVLVVCYEELWPHYLAAPIGKTAFACAFVLSSENSDNLPLLSIPYSDSTLEGFENPPELDLSWCELVKSSPAAAAIPLLQALKKQHSGVIPLNIHATLWFAQCLV
jgi:3-oxoacyl-[acyl-carrier-protein] synthase-1